VNKKEFTLIKLAFHSPEHTWTSRFRKYSIQLRF